MRPALIRKELRQLLPFAVLVFVFLSVDLLYVPLTERLDEHSFAGGDFARGGTPAVLLLLLALVGAFSLFPREQEEGTLDFLYSLPMRRRDVFLAKVAAAAMVLMAGVLYWCARDWLLQLANRQSFARGQLRLSTAGPLCFLYGAYVLIVLGYGLLLSVLRRLGLVLGGLLWWLLAVIEEATPSRAFLNPTNLLDLEHRGAGPLLPWRALGVHGGLAVASLLLAYVLWTVPAERIAALRGRLIAKLWVRLSLGLLGVGVIALVLHQAFKGPGGGRPAVSYQPWAPARFETRHYQFTYPAELRGSAMDLMRQADGAYEEVRRLLRARTAPPIVADLTEASQEHAGLGGWQKIRMDIRGGDDGRTYLRTLHHETTHVFAASESDRRLLDHAGSTKFFDEGLAQHVAHRLVPDGRLLDDQRLLGAISWKRQRIEVDDLVDDRRFGDKFCEDLFYPLGELWVEALARVCGAAAPGDVLRAVRREGAPRELAGRALWQDTLQAIGCELEAVNAAWLRQMERVLARRAEDVRRVPRLSGGVLRADGDHVVLAAYVEPGPGGPPDPWLDYVVRVRGSSDTPEHEVRRHQGQPRQGASPLVVEFRVPRQDLQGERFDLQFGFVFAQGAGEYYERWQQVDVP